MLNSDDRRAIEGLFDRLAEAERRAPDRDRDADELIGRSIGRQPNAPYYMAQTIVVQQDALEKAEERIKELEANASRNTQRSPWDRNDGYDRRAGQGYGGGGGFLAGAMQTAFGVAGGVLLGSAIGSLFGAGHANAGESNNDGGNDGNDNGEDGNDAGGGDSGDIGGGDGGGFDGGGDF